MHGLFLSEIDPPAIGHNFWTAFKNQRLTSSGVSLFRIVQVLDYTRTQHSARFLFWPSGQMHTRIGSPATFCASKRAWQRSPVALPDTLCFLFGFSATLSFARLQISEVRTDGYKGFWETIAANLCFA
jgi:hypothetical protein